MDPRISPCGRVRRPSFPPPSRERRLGATTASVCGMAFPLPRERGESDGPTLAGGARAGAAREHRGRCARRIARRRAGHRPRRPRRGPLPAPGRRVHVLAGAALHRAQRGPRDSGGAGARAARRAAGTGVAAEARRPAAGRAEHRRGVRDRGRLRALGVVQRLHELPRSATLGGPLRSLRHPARARVLQPAARGAPPAPAVVGGAGGDLAPRRAARHAIGRDLASHRMAAAAPGSAGGRGDWSSCSASRASRSCSPWEAGRPRAPWRSRSTSPCVSSSIPPARCSSRCWSSGAARCSSGWGSAS